MIKIEKSNTNKAWVKLLNKISPFAAKKTIYYLQKTRFFYAWKSRSDEAKADIEDFFKTMPLFTHIEIETLNRCNGTCPFCPVNKNDDPRPLAKMTNETFKKIIDNLAKLEFNGRVCYFSNNEPLMDNRIIEFIKYGSQKIPNAISDIVSNGTLLNEEKFQELIDSGLNKLVVDNYSDNLELNQNIQKIYEKYKDEKFGMDCKIHIRFANQILSSRGGEAPNKKTAKKILAAPCFLPFDQLVIRPDGNVSLCCNDALGKITLGNVNEQTLEEIWYGEKHINILKDMRENMRNNISICKNCDMIATKKHNLFYG